MNINEFNELVKSHLFTIAEFSASWCAPCKNLSATLDRIAEKVQGVNIVKLDVEDEPELSNYFGITSVPVMLYYKDGEMVDRTVGNFPEPTILGKIESLTAETDGE